MVAYQESEHRRDSRPHGQALLRTCRLRQQPHRDAGERRRGGRMGDPRHGLRDAVGRTDAADERQGRKHLPQPRLLPHAVLRHSAATRHRKRFFAGRPLGRIHRPLDRVRYLEQDLHRHLRRKPRTATSSPPRATSITTTGSSTPTPRATRSANEGFRTACSCRRSRGTATA